MASNSLAAPISPAPPAPSSQSSVAATSAARQDALKNALAGMTVGQLTPGPAVYVPASLTAEELAVLHEKCPLLRTLRQRQQATREQVAGGLVAGDQQLVEQDVDVLVGESAIQEVGGEP